MNTHHITKTLTSLILASSLFVTGYSHARGSHSFWISRTHENLNKIENYSATIEQNQSSSATPIVSQVNFLKPNSFYSKVLSPNNLAGIEAGFNNQSLLLHNPNNQQALKIDGLKSPTAASKLEQVKSLYWFNQDHYEQEFQPSIHIAKRLAVGLDFKAKNSDAEITELKSYVDYHHSHFMQASYHFNNGTSSSFTHKDIAFNQASVELPKLKVPKKTDISYWNFNAASLTDKQAEERISARIHWPKDKEDLWGFSQYQFYQQDNAETAAAYFYNEAFFIIATTKPEKDAKSLSQGTPLNIHKTQAQFSQFPSFAEIEFKFDGIHYTLLSNIHPQSLIDMAKEIVMNELSGDGIYLTVEG
jgi:outer membrane lipoprotein-sorting protein